MDLPDLVQTLLELADVDPTTSMDGLSLAASMQDEDAPGREEVFLDVGNKGYMMRRGPWKFVLNISLWDGTFEHKSDELYNVVDDPQEMRNRVEEPSQSDRVAEMKERIFQWLEETGHPFAAQLRAKG